jgi:cyanate permease
MPLFICGTLGAASSTWLIGFISDRTGSLHSGMYVLVVSILLLIVLQFVLASRKSGIASD